MGNHSFFLYLALMAGVTYLIRMLPFVLLRKPIKSRFLRSFLYYIPYAVLTAMTVPAIFYATEYRLSAVFGALTALLASFFRLSLARVAALACAAAMLAELVIRNF